MSLDYIVIRLGLPRPKQGGTFTYCPWRHEERSHGSVTVSWCEARWRGRHALKSFRRHWRRHHG